MYHQILRNFPNIKFGENLVSVCRVFCFLHAYKRSHKLPEPV